MTAIIAAIKFYSHRQVVEIETDMGYPVYLNQRFAT